MKVVSLPAAARLGLDEVSDFSYGTYAAHLLFHIVNERHYGASDAVCNYEPASVECLG